MAWTNPKTWSIGEVVTAAMLNTHLRDNLNWILPAPTTWTAYTAVLTDTGGVQNVWGNLNSKYFRSGNLVVAQINVRAAVGNFGTGTYALTLPVASTTATVFPGTASLYDTSATTHYIAHSIYNTSTTVFLVTGTYPSITVGPTNPVPFSTNDQITVTHIYEAA